MKNALNAGKKNEEKKNVIYVMMDSIFQIVIHTFVKGAL